jgi:hypothetical protein
VWGSRGCRIVGEPHARTSAKRPADDQYKRVPPLQLGKNVCSFHKLTFIRCTCQMKRLLVMEVYDVTHLVHYFSSSWCWFVCRLTLHSPPTTTTKLVNVGYTKSLPWFGSHVKL